MIRTNTPTARQQAILDYFDACQAEGLPAPTIREIGEEFKIKSPNGVMCHINALVKKGYLAGEEQVARSYRRVDCPFSVSVTPSGLITVLVHKATMTVDEARKLMARINVALEDASDLMEGGS